MKNNPLVYRLTIITAILVIISGTLLHFAYDFFHESFWVGFVAPVNESVWEHLKLAFFPLLIFGVLEYPILKNKVSNFWLALFAECFFSVIFILVFFYSYTSFTKESILALDISSFILAIIFAKMLSYKILTRKGAVKKSASWPAYLILLLLLFFIIATLSPPRTKLFEDPVTHTFGIYRNF